MFLFFFTNTNERNEAQSYELDSKNILKKKPQLRLKWLVASLLPKLNVKIYFKDMFLLI